MIKKNHQNIITRDNFPFSYNNFPPKLMITEQSGRSMVEMLGVLALMGVLGIAAVAGFRSVMDKHMANTILEDAQVAFIEINSRKDNAQEDWEEITQKFKPVSEGVEFFVKRDPLKQDYVLVTGIEKRVCQQLLTLRAEKKLNFYESEGFDEFTTCQNKTSDDDTETNAIVFAFNGQLAPAECDTTRRCDTLAECELDEVTGETSGCFEGYCTSIGRCQACEPEKYEIVNNDRTGCECNADLAVSCSTDEGDTWCCENTKLCGWEAGECVPDNGCWYKLTQGTKVNACRYTIGATTQIINACRYTVTITSENKAKVEPDTEHSCQPGYYCNLKYTSFSTAGSCAGTAAGNASEVWGACNPVTSNTGICIFSQTVEVKPDTNPDYVCQPGYYCNLKYTSFSTAGSCAGTAAGNASEVWGACNPVTSDTGVCISQSLEVKPQKSCPPNYYCNLRWADQSCKGADGDAETVYGRCMTIDNKGNTSCPSEWGTADSAEEEPSI